MIGAVGRVWRGEYPLPIVFWGFYVGLSILSLIAAAPILALVINSSDRVHSIVYQALVIIRMVLLIWTSAGAWRSAGDYIASADQNKKISGYAARGVVIAWAARVVWTNFGPFTHQLSN